MTGVRSVAVLVVLLQVLAAQGPPVSTQGSGKTWVGRNDEFEEYLKSAECVSMETLEPMKAARCTLPPGGPIARMAWRSPNGPIRGFHEKYKTEIAAYELDKLLKMDMVPPSVERQVQGKTGAATLWLENVDTWKGETPPGDRAEWNKQMARMTMFDALIGNRDRLPGQVLRDGAWNLILLDHTRAFGPSADGRFLWSQIEGDYWARVLALTRKELDARLRPWLNKTEIAAILERRDRIKAEIDRLIAEKGAAAVVLR